MYLKSNVLLIAKKKLLLNRRFQNPVKHLWWSFFAKIVTLQLHHVHCTLKRRVNHVVSVWIARGVFVGIMHLGLCQASIKEVLNKEGITTK